MCMPHYTPEAEFCPTARGRCLFLFPPALPCKVLQHLAACGQYEFRRLPDRTVPRFQAGESSTHCFSAAVSQWPHESSASCGEHLELLEKGHEEALV
mmetsp:Transcript_2506/g.6302  ORF Transcript_2506/g.6302 Transcript_2506/m.6302 type:complete len:97 (+) Transcript_2506:290-580(+)